MTLFILMWSITQSAIAQSEWQMKVCADPSDLPASNEARQGFENQIADILADELNADLQYFWTPNDQTAVRDHLREGDCDLMMGVAEGASNLLNTVAYYRLPYVFVYRTDSPHRITSLQDEALKDLTITTYPNGSPHIALVNLGLRDNTILISPERSVRGAARAAPLVEAVLRGEADLAIIYGSEAAALVRQHPNDLEMVPVTPEIAPPLLPMFRIMTIGVRPGDTALRDRLNIALARRWDEIQAVFDEYSVPLRSLPSPVAPGATSELSARVGVVLPLATGNTEPTDVIGKDARIGAIMAEDLVGRGVSQTGVTLRVFLASAPNLASSVRAAERLVSTDEVSVLVGGFNKEEAQALSEVAAARGVLFFNIGSPDDSLRGALCKANTFHVEASAAMYIDALVDWFASEDKKRWFLVYEDTPAGQDQFERATAAVLEAGGEIAGTAEVQRQQFVYQDELEQLNASSPDVVLLLLTAQDQELFLAQYEVEDFEYPITGFPTEISQTRDFFFRFSQTAPSAAGYRIALWETTLTQNGAQDINERFMARTGEPMDPAAWASYAAIKIAYEALVATGSTEAAELRQFLESDASFDVHKGSGVSFRAWNHQLRQPLYLLEIDPEATWSTTLSDRIAVGNLIGELPTLYLPSLSPSERLDRLGTGAEATACEF